MAALTASPPTTSPTSHSPLSPLVTNSNNNNNNASNHSTSTSNASRRNNSSQRPASWTAQRQSSNSAVSKVSRQQESRPASHVFPLFHSSLEYSLVRDFAYQTSHPMHYGPPPASEASTPLSESRRLSDPVATNWEDSQTSWSAASPWMSDQQQSADSRDQLPAMTFSGDGGPPYSEDEDLHSPIVTTSKKKHRSQASGLERGRSPGAAGPNRGTLVDLDVSNSQDGPGGVIENYPRRHQLDPKHRDSTFAKPLNRDQSPLGLTPQQEVFEDDLSEDDAARYSKDYSFTIASPDEEMHGKAVALFDFESEHPNELPLKEGQIILVSYRHGQGWLVAEDPRTGESGLVPEEFVRLVRDIEGGLNGLNAVTLNSDDNGDGALSPVSIDPVSATTPTQGHHEFPHHAPKLSGEKHPPVQSNFSTRREDFLERSPVDVLRERSQGSQARRGNESL